MTMQPGWYHAEGDPPNTQRYWDGAAWQTEPVPAQSGASQMPSGTSSATAVIALVLGICGIVVCQVLAPVAWIVGKRAEAEIDAGRGAAKERGLATAGKVLGIIGTVLVLVVLVGLLLFVFLASV